MEELAVIAEMDRQELQIPLKAETAVALTILTLSILVALVVQAFTSLDIYVQQ
jgi:hypothetical protein